MKGNFKLYFLSFLLTFFIVFIFSLPVFLLFNYVEEKSIEYEEEYKLTSETIIVDKFITHTDYGTPRYYLVYKDNNGTILQENVNPDVYYRFEIDEVKGE